MRSELSLLKVRRGALECRLGTKGALSLPALSLPTLTDPFPPGALSLDEDGTDARCLHFGQRSLLAARLRLEFQLGLHHSKKSVCHLGLLHCCGALRDSLTYLCCSKLGLVALGSCWFHATLSYEGQVLDELPMIYGTVRRRVCLSLLAQPRTHFALLRSSACEFQGV